MNSTAQIPTTQNETWGFWGTTGEHAHQGWPLACGAIAQATDAPPHAVRAFLDSRYGRHFADDVLNELTATQDLTQAIQAVTQRWMGWTIGRHTSRQYDIPRGLPYLIGLVVHCGIIDELAM